MREMHYSRGIEIEFQGWTCGRPQALKVSQEFEQFIFRPGPMGYCDGHA